VVPLLSGASIHSEMLEMELETAHRANQTQGGKPRILPIRVAYAGPLPASLGVILDPLQQAEWQGPQDDARIIGEVVRALALPPDEDRAIPETLEPVGGAVPLGSEFYIARPQDEEFLRAIARGDSVVLVKGARQMGKTSLLARGLQKARESGTRVAYTDFQSLNLKDFATLDAFYMALAGILAARLGLRIPVKELWDPDLGPNGNLELLVETEILGAIPEPVVWGMDEVDRLFPCDFGSEAFGLFRSWHNRRAFDPAGPWSRLTLAMAYATEAHLFISDLNQSPFNVGTRLTLEDFTSEQVADLNRRYRSPLRDGAELARFGRLVGGHPYLVRKGLDEMATRGIAVGELEQQADRDEGLFGDHLRRLLATLSRDAVLTEAMRGVLRGGAGPDQDSFFRLRTAGVLVGDSREECRPRCQLYASYLRRHLL
jgi:hypothetical protein